MATESETVTISRDVFERVVGEAFAAFGLAQWNYMILVRRGYLTAEEASAGLRQLADIAKRAGPLAKLAAPKFEEALDQLQRAIHSVATPSGRPS